MVRVMFVCHGNICRSPMAEFLFKKEVGQRGLSEYFVIESSATTFDAINCPVFSGTKKILEAQNIDCSKKRAVHLESDDYERYDYFLVMDNYNLRDAKNILSGDKLNKVLRLMDFTLSTRDVADPWYTHDFNATFKDIKEGIDGFLDFLIKTDKLPKRG